MKLIHILLGITLLLCSSGIGSAANDTGSSMTMFTDDHIQTAKDTIANSGVSNLIALIQLGIILVVWGSPAVLLLVAIVALGMHKHDLYKTAIKGFVLMVIVLLAYNLYVSFIGSLTPDLSTIPI